MNATKTKPTRTHRYPKISVTFACFEFHWVMNRLLSTSIGRLRILGILEGISLLLLFGIAMPVKYILGNPALVKSFGMAHGILFILFVLYTISASISYSWKFGTTTWKVLLGCVLPFGSFYVDKKILSRMPH